MMLKPILVITLLSLFLLSCKKGKNDPTPDLTHVSIEGTDYPTTKIGKFLLTAENYNGPGGSYYFNPADNSGTNYGKLYNINEALKIKLPTGWRLPTQADYELLLYSMGGKIDSYGYVVGDSTVALQLQSKSGWWGKQGNNKSGFNAYPAGWKTSSEIYSSWKGGRGCFWTSTLNSQSKTYSYLLLISANNWNSVSVQPDYDGISGDTKLALRFVKDL